MSTPTANYGWMKPDVGGDLDAWGGEINATLDGVDSTVHGVDVRIPLASATAPGMDGAAAAGTGTAYAREDHVHPTDTSRAAASAVPAPSSSTPLMDGAAAPGTGAAYSRSDHVHPVDISRYDASNPAGYINAAGAPVQSVSTRAGAIVLTHTDITDWTTALSGYALAGSQPSPSTSDPLMDGAVSPGVSTSYSSGDHVHPSDSSKYSTTNPSNYQTGAQVTSALSGYLPRAGVTNGSNAPAGQIGEYLTSSNLTDVAMLTQTAYSVNALDLSAGDWDVEGVGFFNASAASNMVACVTPDSGVVSTAGAPGRAQIVLATENLGVACLPTGRIRASLSAPTTLYLVMLAGFSTGVCSGQGSLTARRIR